MAIVQKTGDKHQAHRSCDKCDAEFEMLKLSGVGDWRNRIMCRRCGNYWTVPMRIIYQLVYEQYPSVSSPARAEAILDQAQREYEAEIARQSGF